MKCTDLVGAALLHMGVYGLATNVNMSSPNLLGTNKTGRSCIKKKKTLTKRLSATLFQTNESIP